MFNLKKLKKIYPSSKLKKILDNLSLQIESIKGDYDLDKIFELIGNELLKINISSIISIIDDKRQNVVVRHISIDDDYKLYFPKDKVKKIEFSKLDKYQIALQKREALFCKNRVRQFKTKFPQIKSLLDKINKEIDSIIAPLILRGEVIGFLEIFSSDLNEKDINVVKEFSQRLVLRIANTILFQEVKKSEERYKELWANAPVAYHILDSQGIIIKVNQTEAKMLGYSINEMAGRSIFEFIPPEQRADARRRFSLKLAGRKLPKKDNRIYVKKDDSRIYVSIDDVLERDSEGNVIGVRTTMLNITENKQLQDKIEQAKNHYEQVINTIQDGICVINKNFKIVGCNKTFSEKINLPLNDLKNKKCQKIIIHYENDLFKNFCSQVCQDNKCIVARVFQNGKTVFIEKKNKDNFGKAHYHKISVFPTKDKAGKIYQAVVTIRDVTERKEAEEEVRRLSEFSQRILNNAPVSIVVLNKKGIIIAVNDLAKTIMGKSEKQILDRKLMETRNIKENNELTKQYKLLLSKGESFYYDNLPYLHESDSEQKYLNIIAVPLFDKKKKVDGAISMALDNTEAVLAKQELQKLNLGLEKKVTQRTYQLDKINKELSKVLELKSKFITDASHELRTPLTIIQGNLDLAIRECDNTKRKAPETFYLINKEIRHMTSILTDLTVLTNIDSRSENIAYEKVDLLPLIKDVCQSLKVLADRQHIKIKQMKGNRKLEIMGDETKLEKLLLNIMRNAIKYNKEKGWIKIWAEKGASEAKIFIEDSGIGIPEQDLPYIFERFYRVDKARSKSRGGTGLGLAICKWIAEAHGGRISVESKLGIGSKFIVYLPYDFKKQKERSLF